MSVIQLGGMTFPGAATSGWWFSELADWLDVTEAKGSWSERPVSHGAFDRGFGWRARSSPSLRVHFLGEDSAAALTAMERLRGIVGAGLIEMVVDLGNGTRSRMVRVDSIDIPDGRDRRVMTATIYCSAPDPLAYGSPLVGVADVPTGGVGVADPLADPVREGEQGNLGRVTLTNDGTASTSVQVTVHGGLSEGVQILVVETGAVLRLERSIPNGSKVVFDSATGRVVIDEQSDVTGFLTIDQWPQIPAQSTRSFQFMPLGQSSGAPRMVVTARPAYF